jgi:hypothetical protein
MIFGSVNSESTYTIATTAFSVSGQQNSSEKKKYFKQRLSLIKEENHTATLNKT